MKMPNKLLDPRRTEDKSPNNQLDSGIGVRLRAPGLEEGVRNKVRVVGGKGKKKKGAEGKQESRASPGKRLEKICVGINFFGSQTAAKKKSGGDG